MSQTCVMGHGMPDGLAWCPVCGFGALPTPPPPDVGASEDLAEGSVLPQQPVVPAPQPASPPPAEPVAPAPVPRDLHQWAGASTATSTPPPPTSAPSAPASTASWPVVGEPLPASRRPALPRRLWQGGLRGRAALLLPVLLLGSGAAFVLTGGLSLGGETSKATNASASKRVQCVSAAMKEIEGSYGSSATTHYYRLSDGAEISREEFNSLGNQYARFTTVADPGAQSKAEQGDATLRSLYNPAGRFSSLPSPVSWIAAKGAITNRSVWPSEMKAYCASLEAMFAQPVEAAPAASEPPSDPSPSATPSPDSTTIPTASPEQTKQCLSDLQPIVTAYLRGDFGRGSDPQTKAVAQAPTEAEKNVMSVAFDSLFQSSGKPSALTGWVKVGCDHIGVSAFNP